MSNVKIVFNGGVECDLRVNENAHWLARTIEQSMDSKYAFSIEATAGHIIINPENVMCITVMEVKE